MTTEIRAINESDYTVDALVSDDSPDRHETIIAKGAYAARLSSYLANPILCWGHPVGDWFPRGPEDLIGKAIETKQTDRGLEHKFQYAVKENERAALVWRLVAGKYLRMYSVGILVHGAVTIFSEATKIASLPDAYKKALEDGDVWAIITDAELVENSQVFVGSNRNALAKALHAGVLDRRGLELLCPDHRIPDPRRSLWTPPPFRDLGVPPAEEPAPQPGPEPGPESAPEPAPAADPELQEEKEFEALLDEDSELCEAFLSALEAPIMAALSGERETK
jgi:hypothetical protein